MNLKRLLVLAGLFLAPLSAMPQADTMSVEEALRMGRQFLEDNLDPEFLAALGDLNGTRATTFFQALEQRLSSDYVFDLVEARKIAQAWLPVLEAHEQTAPYAAWLRTRLDLMEAAEQLQELTPPPPKAAPGQPPARRPNPTPELQKKVWQKRVEARPLPPQAKPYADALKKIFAAQGLPAELIWLAEVESAFNPKARSPVGAAGLFQLMPPTAQWLGLSTFVPDERLDPEKSGAAAARYLKYLYGHFKDWKLALAAYNLGEGRLRKLMTQHKASSFEALSPRLPAETQMYVPKFAAVLHKREGLTLDKLAAPKS